MRANLREAVGLLKQAGYELRNGQMTDVKSGEPLTVEFLEFQSVFERVILPFAAQLKLIGINSSPAGHRPGPVPEPPARLRFRHHHEFVAGIPLAGQRAARVLGLGRRRQGRARATSIGIKDAGVDALVEKVIFAKDRPGARWRRPTPSTGCCWPTISWCRNGAPASRAPCAGTVSGTRRSCRNTAVRASRRPGGTTRRWPPRPGHRVERAARPGARSSRAPGPGPPSSSPARARRRRRTEPRPVELRRPEIPADFPNFDYVNPAAPRGGASRRNSPRRWATRPPTPSTP